MGALVWVMIGLALWHFTVYLPDHFLGGIAGAFVGAILGSLIGGLLIHGFSVPGRHAVHLMTAIEAVPGTAIGVGIVYALGLRQERTEAAAPSSYPRRFLHPVGVQGRQAFTRRAGSGECRTRNQHH